MLIKLQFSEASEQILCLNGLVGRSWWWGVLKSTSLCLRVIATNWASLNQINAFGLVMKLGWFSMVCDSQWLICWQFTKTIASNWFLVPWSGTEAHALENAGYAQFSLPTSSGRHTLMLGVDSLLSEPMGLMRIAWPAQDALDYCTLGDGVQTCAKVWHCAPDYRHLRRLPIAESNDVLLPQDGDWYVNLVLLLSIYSGISWCKSNLCCTPWKSQI